MEVLFYETLRPNRSSRQNNENMIAFDRDGRITYINQAFADLLKLKKWQAIGKNIWTLQPDLVGTTVNNNVIEAIEKKTARRLSGKALRRARFGKPRFFLQKTVSQHYQDITSKETHMKLATIAKTREAALKDSEDRDMELVEGLPEMVIEVDAQGQIVFANSKVTEIMGYSKDKLNSSFDANRLVAKQD